MLSKKLVLSFSAIIISLLFSACHCGPGMVTATEEDDSFPIGSWVVTVLSEDADGNMISALTTYSEEENNITVRAKDKITVNLMGRDEQSGIKYLEMRGGFGFTCTNPANSEAQAIDGIIPVTSRTLTPVSGCGKIEAFLNPVDLNFELCEAPFKFSSGGYAFTGIVHNHAQIEILTRLTITVIPIP